MKNPEIIPKEYDWIIATASGCIGIAMALVMLPYSLAVLMSALGATNLRNANQLLGTRRRPTTYIMIGFVIVLASTYGAERLHLAKIDLEKGRQNYFFVAGLLAVALWELSRILLTKMKKSNE